jgi:demethylmenaquinone methyltransferase/2-methoxy-6-polyprenyl-1,4-benzoquinol methylase
VLDIGCGTGGFALKLAARCRHVTGLDISKKQIGIAKKRMTKRKITNIDFVHVDAGEFDQISDRKYNLGVLSFVIHEMDHQERLSVLSAAKKTVSKLIILDYHTPHPKSFWGQMTRLIEYFAGKEHFRNFKDYLLRDGLDGILEEAGLIISDQFINRKHVFRTVIVETRK